jgi:hypothetical protein
VLHSLIQSGLVPVVDLREIFRQVRQQGEVDGLVCIGLGGVLVWGLCGVVGVGCGWGPG